jgi:hypothetical protein
MNELKIYGINDLLLENICKLVKEDHEPQCMLNGDRPSSAVSIPLCRASRNPKKLWRAFYNLGIYNIVYVHMNPAEHTFAVKAFNGGVLNIAVEKEANKSFKKVVIEALLKVDTVIDEIRDEENAKQAKQAKLLKELFGDLKVSIPPDLEMTPELADSLKGVLADIESGKASHLETTDGLIAEGEFVDLPAIWGDETVEPINVDLADVPEFELVDVDQGEFIDNSFKSNVDIVNDTFDEFTEIGSVTIEPEFFLLGDLE